MKKFKETENVGKARYVVSFHDGLKKHEDGSPFYDVAVFHNKKKKDRFVKLLVRHGYICEV